ncbi:DUF4142 domain-containing protein [Pelotalea chapellei]|uniref:DUF4142 domain-containing protein n=1 Tax=Pelotalea chapellei TaxID=44671 RepID=A0ABS5U6X2_9BACT|nr:DUF4142 domain-containing protein [Pelotalea chapellei]MBT1071405.1 DUF4142 domain-containing protein [Pelotalea chapellei]
MRKGTWLGILIGLLAIAFAIPLFAADKGPSGADKKFFMEAASGGMMEVQLGQLARDKGQTQDVKDFGSRMVTDHTKANDELKQLAQQKNWTMPTKLERKHKSMMDKMQKASGPEFDKQYMKGMVKDHTKDIEDFRKATEKVKDPDLKAWAQKTLPVLEQHLQLAKDTAGKVGADVGKAGKAEH